jgi:biotin carboxyl carrier protein
VNLGFEFTENVLASTETYTRSGVQQPRMIYNVTIDGTEHRLNLEFAGGRWRCQVEGHEMEMDAVLTRPDVLSVVIAGKAYDIRRERIGADVRIWVGDRPHVASVQDPRSLRGRRERSDHGGGARQLVAPMPGKVIRFLVEEKAVVEAGQGVVVVEAMKMQNEIKSPKQGVVVKLVVAEGAAVNAGDVLAIVE